MPDIASGLIVLLIYFSDANGNPADPGAFEVDIQCSDIDADAHYTTSNSLTGALNASFSGRVGITNFAKYVRCVLKSLAISVYVSVLATH